MQRRTLGRAGLEVSVLGFGCGTVGGLMINGRPRDQERAVGRAIDLGINYFDTAQQYGEGRSEECLGGALRSLKADVLVATKVKVPSVERGRIRAEVAAALDASLKRLGRDHVDLFQMHNAISTSNKPGCLTPELALDEVVPAMQRMVDQGKARFFGMTGLGETDALMRLVDAKAFFTAQIPLNLLNPSPAWPVAPGYPAQDYAQMLGRMTAAGMGGVGIRVMAAGALSTDTPHPLAKDGSNPMGTGSTFARDKARAARFQALVAEGHAESLAAAAVRYALAAPGLSIVLLGLSDASQLEGAARAAVAGPLSPEAMARVAQIQAGYVGEAR